MKKGFTLIELLAVLIILAIIALIAVPVALNIINSSKESSRLRSAELYVNAANTALSRHALKRNVPSGTYNILNTGNLCYGETINNNTICSNPQNEFEVEFDGTSPSGGIIVVDGNKVIDVQGLVIEGSTYAYNQDNELIKIESDYYILMPGVDFNITVKALVSNIPTSKSLEVSGIEYYSQGQLPEGYTLDELRELPCLFLNNMFNAYYDTTEKKLYIYSGQDLNLEINSIKFYSNNELPKGYTLSQLQELPSMTVENLTGTTLAYYDGLKQAIYICSEGKAIASWAQISINFDLEHIEFYSNGNLPEGYTIATLKQLPSRSVSISGQEIKAYYDKQAESVYVYSKGDIAWTKDTDYMFTGFLDILDVNLPNGVSNINKYTFWGCDELRYLTINSGVVETNAFSDSFNLRTVTINGGTIKAGAFSGADALETVTVDGGTIEPNAFEDCDSFTTLIIGNNVKSIDDHAFEGYNLENLTIGNSVETIGDYAFADSGYTSQDLIIPDSVIVIGSYAFDGFGFSNATIGRSVNYIGDHAFGPWDDGTGGSVCHYDTSGSYGITFLNPTGWYIDNYDDYITQETCDNEPESEICMAIHGELDFSNKSEAAWYLCEFSDYTWRR